MKAIIGLGNPGIKYEQTRHNVGYHVIHELSKADLVGQFKESSRLFAQILLNTTSSSEQILLVCPVTYMNDSGKAFIAIKNWYKLDLNDILVIHDDVSLPLGKIRLQKEGGAGGQHGVESIINNLGGDKTFNRLKVGIGPDPGGDLRANYVLQKFTDREKLVLNKVIKVAAEASLSWLNFGIERTMNEFNGLEEIKLGE